MEATIQFLLQLADDQLIIGHRNSEWTGIGPTLEEDIAFSSMAQDKIGHAWSIYKILHAEFDQDNPDKLGFQRQVKDYKCCQLTELPTRDFSVALMRQFLFDHAEMVRFETLEKCSLTSLAQFCSKAIGEVKYHILHGDTWIKNLGKANEESIAKLQSALNELFPYALGMFEETEYSKKLQEDGFYAGENAIKTAWYENISEILGETALKVPSINSEAINGGRTGFHTEYLQDMVTEMTEVISSDYNAEW